MCLIVFAWKVVPGIPLVLACNRDEFYQRPTAPATWWTDHPQIYAGRDLQGGGTWLGITREGRFAALTNIRAPAEHRADVRSRGMLVTDYLLGNAQPEAFVEEIAEDAEKYNGYNLLIGTQDKLIWYNNRNQDDNRNGKPLTPGVYGLSNASLDTPWPKVVRTKAQFSSLLCQGAPHDAYFEMLTDTTKASSCRLPKTGIDTEWERTLSAVCINSPAYGTRSSSIVQVYLNREPILLEHIIHPDANTDTDTDTNTDINTQPNT